MPSPSLLRNATSPMGRGLGRPVRPTLDEQSFFISKTAVPCYRGQQLRNNILVKLLLISVAGHSFLRYIELSASSRKWPGLPKPLPLGEVSLRSNDGEGKPAGGSRSGFPSYNLSVSLPLDSSPSRGASGVSARPMLDEQSFFILKTAVPCCRGQQLLDKRTLSSCCESL